MTVNISNKKQTNLESLVQTRVHVRKDARGPISSGHGLECSRTVKQERHSVL